MHSKLFVTVIFMYDSHTTATSHVSDNILSANGAFRPCENHMKTDIESQRIRMLPTPADICIIYKYYIPERVIVRMFTLRK